MSECIPLSENSPSIPLVIVENVDQFKSIKDDEDLTRDQFKLIRSKSCIYSFDKFARPHRKLDKSNCLISKSKSSSLPFLTFNWDKYDYDWDCKLKNCTICSWMDKDVDFDLDDVQSDSSSKSLTIFPMCSSYIFQTDCVNAPYVLREHRSLKSTPITTNKNIFNFENSTVGNYYDDKQENTTTTNNNNNNKPIVKLENNDISFEKSIECYDTCKHFCSPSNVNPSLNFMNKHGQKNKHFSLINQSKHVLDPNFIMALPRFSEKSQPFEFTCVNKNNSMVLDRFVSDPDQTTINYNTDYYRCYSHQPVRITRSQPSTINSHRLPNLLKNKSKKSMLLHNLKKPQDELKCSKQHKKFSKNRLFQPPFNSVEVPRQDDNLLKVPVQLNFSPVPNLINSLSLDKLNEDRSERSLSIDSNHRFNFKFNPLSLSASGSLLNLEKPINWLRRLSSSRSR